MKAAVYPGSFNPLHKGHVQLIHYLLDSAGFDRVYLIVSPHNPFKDKSLNDSAAERFTAAVKAVEKLGLGDRVVVDDIELGMEGPSYTIKTLDALQRREPDKSFTLAVGADILPEFPQWKEWLRILCEYGVVVYPREGFDMKKDLAAVLAAARDSAGKLKIRLLSDAVQVDVSSTEIRQMEALGMDSSSLKA